MPGDNEYKATRFCDHCDRYTDHICREEKWDDYQECCECGWHMWWRIRRYEPPKDYEEES